MAFQPSDSLSDCFIVKYVIKFPTNANVEFGIHSSQFPQ